MTYSGFHAVFILPPILMLAWLTRGQRDRIGPNADRYLLAIALIAFAYTTPWDNYLVFRGVWDYGPDRVIGTIGYVPIEEYLFFLLQPLLTGLWLYGVALRRKEVGPAHGPSPAAHERYRDSRPEHARIGGAVIYGIAALAGSVALRSEEGTYLGLILIWAAPVLFLQWAYAGREIWARRGLWALATAIPTAYLWVADGIAIHLNIWRISDSLTLGIRIGPLPLEEAIFFLVTNLLVVQGLMLFLWPPRHSARESSESAGSRRSVRDRDPARAGLSRFESRN